MLLGLGFFFRGGSLSSDIEIGAPDTIRVFPIKFQVRCCWLEGYFKMLELQIGHIFASLATAGFILDKLMGKMTRLLILPAVGSFLCHLLLQSLLNHNQGAVWFLFTGSLPVSDSGCYGVTCCLSVWRHLTSLASSTCGI